MLAVVLTDPGVLLIATDIVRNVGVGFVVARLCAFLAGGTDEVLTDSALYTGFTFSFLRIIILLVSLFPIFTSTGSAPSLALITIVVVIVLLFCERTITSLPGGRRAMELALFFVSKVGTKGALHSSTSGSTTSSTGDGIVLNATFSSVVSFLVLRLLESRKPLLFPPPQPFRHLAFNHFPCNTLLPHRIAMALCVRAEGW
jgi:hypothetical protein